MVLVCALALAVPACAAATLLRGDTTPFPPSKRILAAWWTTPRFGPPPNQTGDLLPTIWGDDGNQYTLIDDGGADVPIAGGMWRQSLARIIGSPPRPRFRHVGNPYNPPARTYAQIMSNPKLWLGPLGPYYSSGLVEANHVFFATQQYDWDWTENGLFAGLDGIAYSLDHGRNWLAVNKPFPAPLGNLSWMIRGRGGVYPDGWVYAIGSEREFNASTLILGRSRPDVADMTDPSRWEWLSGSPSSDHPTFSSSFSNAVPIVSWNSHITYPQIAYDSPIHRYLLTFTFSYGTKPPATWRRGMELVILEAGHPWGPYSFVARQRYFGPSNGYGAGFPIKWISRDGHNLWLKWAANFDGCAPRLDCSGAYGFNFRRLHLKLAGSR
jgi:hypothetical protein